MLRESLLEPNATVVEMMAELHRVYSAKAKPVACSMKRANWPRRCACRGEEEFLAFSRAATGRLR
ncbi:hypothetical protein MJ561_20495 [Klebsiella pneumoniae]|nr:hypothetical protein MJ561_20495 [Klebsiella pneumoniae]